MSKSIEMTTVPKKDYADDVDMVEAARRNIIRYSLETFTRAFPSAYDGLKPVARRIIYTMWVNKNFNYVKVANITGAVLGSYHPHGDASVTDALVHLAQPWVQNYPYVVIQGNQGNQDGDSAAAARYIEAKISDFAKKVILDDIDDVSVNYVDNFDYTKTIPDYFPTRIPLVLINGISGIGEAYRVNIPPHNLNDIADICIKYIKNKNISNTELVDGLYPDFPTGGEIINGAELEKFYKGGEPVTIAIRGKVELHSDTNTIVIKEFPYGIACDDVAIATSDAWKAGNMILSGIEKIQDTNHHNDDDDGTGEVSEAASTDTKPRKRVQEKKTYEYKCKKDASMIEILNEIYRITSLKTTIPLSFMINQKGYPVYVTIKDIVEQWYKIRVDSKRRKHTNIIAQSYSKKHILEGILSVYDRIDDVIKAIRTNKDDKDTLIKQLHEKFGLTVVQAKGIYEMPVGSLSAFGKSDLENRIKEADTYISDNDYLLTHIDDTIISELEELKTEFGRPRRTTITMSIEEQQTSKLALTKGAFIYAYNAIGLYDSNGVNDSKNILTGLKTYKRVEKNVREIIGGTALRGTPKGFVVCYDNGGINRIDASVFRVVNVWYDLGLDGSISVTCAAPIYDDDDVVVCIGNDNKIKQISVTDINGKRIVSSGSVIKSICSYNPAKDKNFDRLLMVAENGTYNLCDIDEVPLLGRAAGGVKSAFDEDTLSAKVFMTLVPSEVFDEDRVMVSSVDSKDGQNYMHSIPLTDLKLASRTAKPKLIGLPKPNSVNSIQLCNVSDKDTQLCMIGKSSTSSLNITNFKKPYDFKRLFMTVVSSTQL